MKLRRPRKSELLDRCTFGIDCLFLLNHARYGLDNLCRAS
jgi:hypothetical protein